MSDIKEW